MHRFKTTYIEYRTRRDEIEVRRKRRRNCHIHLIGVAVRAKCCLSHVLPSGLEICSKITLSALQGVKIYVVVCKQSGQPHEKCLQYLHFLAVDQLGRTSIRLVHQPSTQPRLSPKLHSPSLSPSPHPRFHSRCQRDSAPFAKQVYSFLFLVIMH
jgi:hypothetical protein